MANKGAMFEKLSCSVLSAELRKTLSLGKKIPIGNPAKEHSFDIANTEDKIAIECKCIGWTKGKKFPGAKISSLNEAVFFLTLLPEDYQKIICIAKDVCDGKSLAEEYVRLYKHLLDGIDVYEIDEVSRKSKRIY